MLLISQAVHFGRPLVRSKEERFVVHDRATDGSTELVMLQICPRLTVEIGKEIIGVEDVVAHKLPGAAVEFVGSALAYQVDVGSGSASVRGVEVGRLHAELLNRIRRWNRRAGVGFSSSG